MLAVRCHRFGALADLVIEECPSLTPGPAEVLIRVFATGINFPDLLLVRGLYQRKPSFPFIPGAEVSGVISAVGSQVTALHPGDLVSAQMRDGGYAEEVVVDQESCYPLESDVDLVKAAAYLVGYGTAYHALKDRARLLPGETILVLGAAGGVGLAAVELAKLLGARVIACASTDTKLALCAQYGADELLNYSKTDLREGIKSCTGSGQVDVIFDPVGGRITDAGFRSLSYGGRYLVIGFASGQIPKIALNLPLLKAASIVGVFWGRFIKEWPQQARSNHQLLTTWLNQGKIKPFVEKTFPLKEAVTAMKWIDDRMAMGKIVLRT